MGLKPDEFWRLTYAEFHEMMKGYRRARIETVNENTRTAWFTAYMTRIPTLEPLQTYLIDDSETDKHAQTDDEMMSKCKILNALFGGEMVEVCDG